MNTHNLRENLDEIYERNLKDITPEKFEKELEQDIAYFKSSELEKLECEWAAEKESFYTGIKDAPANFIKYFKNDPKKILIAGGIIAGGAAVIYGLRELDSMLPPFPEVKLPPAFEKLNELIGPYAQYVKVITPISIASGAVYTLTPLKNYFIVRRERSGLKNIDPETEAKNISHRLNECVQKIISCEKSNDLSEAVILYKQIYNKRMNIEQAEYKEYNHIEEFHVSNDMQSLYLLLRYLSDSFGIDEIYSKLRD